MLFFNWLLKNGIIIFRCLVLLVLLEIQWVLQGMLGLVSRIFYLFLARESYRWATFRVFKLVRWMIHLCFWKYNWQLWQSPSGLLTSVAEGSRGLLSSTVYAISSATSQFSKAAHKVISVTWINYLYYIIRLFQILTFGFSGNSCIYIWSTGCCLSGGTAESPRFTWQRCTEWILGGISSYKYF